MTRITRATLKGLATSFDVAVRGQGGFPLAQCFLGFPQNAIELRIPLDKAGLTCYNGGMGKEVGGKRSVIDYAKGKYAHW